MIFQGCCTSYNDAASGLVTSLITRKAMLRPHGIKHCYVPCRIVSMQFVKAAGWCLRKEHWTRLVLLWKSVGKLHVELLAVLVALVVNQGY